MIEFFDLAQVAGGLIVVTGYVPQIVRIVRAKSAQGLSLGMWGSVFAGLALMEAYALDLARHGEPMLLLTNSMSLLLSGTLIGLIVWYAREARTEHPTLWQRISPGVSVVRARATRVVLALGLLRRI
jgi:MtN3 and saliva related transmembrane protein